MENYKEYLSKACEKLCSIMISDAPAIENAAQKILDALVSGGYLFMFGTGHSHMMAEELFYRAGGLVRVKPIFEEALMLHKSASMSTELERSEGYGEELAVRYEITGRDILIIASNSGRNPVAIDLALEAKRRGASVIALTSLTHSSAVKSRHISGKRLFEVSDYILDNHSDPGEACMQTGKWKVSPVSTVTGAALLQALVAQVAALAHAQNANLEVFSSSNIDGGDQINQRYLQQYVGKIPSL